MNNLSFKDYILLELTDIEAETTIQGDATQNLRRKPTDNEAMRAAKKKILDQKREKKTPLDNRIRALKLQLAKALQQKKAQAEIS